MITYAVILISLSFFLLKRFLSRVWRIKGLSEKAVLVTGCDTGFGYSLAIKLCNNGVRTFAACLTEPGREQLETAATGAPGKLITFILDVTQQDSVDEAVRFVGGYLNNNEGLWGLVNNAGIMGYNGPDDWLQVNDYQQTLDVNCLGVIRVTHGFKKYIKRAKGRIVTVTSLYSRWPTAMNGPYTISKCAVEAYMDTIRLELKPYGVSAHIVQPGFFCTNVSNPKLNCQRLLDRWHELTPEIRTEYGDEFIIQSHEALDKHIKFMCDMNGTEVDSVVEAYYQALTSRLPRDRYYVGFDMHCLLPVYFLPTWASDLFQVVYLKLRKYPVPLVCKTQQK